MPCMQVKNARRLEREKEERGIVVYWTDVVGVVLAEAERVIAFDEGSKRVLQVMRRRIQQLEGRVAGDVMLDRYFFFRRERRFLCNHRDIDTVFVELSLGSHNKVT